MRSPWLPGAIGGLHLRQGHRDAPKLWSPTLKSFGGGARQSATAGRSADKNIKKWLVRRSLKGEGEVVDNF